MKGNIKGGKCSQHVIIARHYVVLQVFTRYLQDALPTSDTDQSKTNIKLLGVCLIDQFSLMINILLLLIYSFHV